MAILTFIGIILSGYVVHNMNEDDRTRYFLVFGALLLIILLPKLLGGKL